MASKDFPLTSNKVEGLNQTFDLTDPVERKKYFKAKVGGEIEKLKTFMDNNTFVGFLLGKKIAGKGTYSKIFTELVGANRFEHLSVGDLVREVENEFNKPDKKEQITKFIKSKYRGFMPVAEALEKFANRDIKSLLPTEFILTLIEYKIENMPKKSIFIDGFPRDMDQISYSLYFRDLINYRDDPDFFVLLNVPESVIDERIKYRRVCPKCQTSRNYKLLATSDVRYDRDKDEFYLYCDNPDCEGAKMVAKEGDEKGIENIRDRIDIDQKLLDMAFDLHGVPKILLRNAIPVDKADELFDDYEITPEFVYQLEDNDQVKVSTRSWTVKDDNGLESYSLLPAAVVVSMIRQMVKVLDL